MSASAKPPRRERQDDGLKHEQQVGPEHGGEYLPETEAFAQALNFVGTVDVGVAQLALLLGETFEEDGGACLLCDDEVEELGQSTKAKLGPEIEAPGGETLLDGSTCDAAEDGAQAREEGSPEDSVLLFVWTEHVCYHSHGDRTTR